MSGAIQPSLPAVCCRPGSDLASASLASLLQRLCSLQQPLSMALWFQSAERRAMAFSRRLTESTLPRPVAWPVI